MANMHDLFLEILEVSQDDPNDDSLASYAKMGEEFGEVGEAILNDHGYIQYKQITTSVIDESADMINTVLAMLTVHFKDKDPEEIYELLLDATERKLAKYKTVVLKSKHMKFNNGGNDDTK